MSGGWIPAWRKLFDREDWMRPTKRNPASYVHAWLDLCQMAQHKDGHEQGEVRLAQGEVLVANRTLAKRWGWSKSAVSRFIERAKRGTMIGTVRGTPQGTVYRIVKYEDYAIPEKHSRDSSRDSSRDTSGTPAGQEQQLTINKQQTDLVDKSTAQTKVRQAYTSDFEQVWSIHGRGAKRKAFDEYRKAVPKRVTHEQITSNLKAYVRSFDDGFNGAHLFRWIKEERWEEHLPSTNGNGTHWAEAL